MKKKRDTESSNRGDCFAQVVSDQVRLWQAETKRVRDFESHLYDNFESEQLFVATANQAR